jgi:hypothetical protein
MSWLWMIVPVILGFAYMILTEKYPDLEDRLSPFITPLLEFIGYVVGVVVIIALLWGMFS